MAIPRSYWSPAARRDPPAKPTIPREGRALRVTVRVARRPIVRPVRVTLVRRAATQFPPASNQPGGADARPADAHFSGRTARAWLERGVFRVERAVAAVPSIRATIVQGNA